VFNEVNSRKIHGELNVFKVLSRFSLHAHVRARAPSSCHQIRMSRPSCMCTDTVTSSP
jgi:hypothetical protein